MPSTTHGLPYPAGSSPTNVPGDLQALADAVNTILDPILNAWTSYTPTWTGGSPTIGNGTLVGSYRTVGKTVQYRVELTIGSTTNPGSGTWLFTVPASPTAAAESVVGSGMAFDSSAPARVGLVARHSSTPGAISLIRADTGAAVTNSAPYTWATGDRVSFTGFFEIA